MNLVQPRYQWFRHCEVLAEVLQRVAEGELKRVMVFMPPRHGKSEEVSRLFAAYYLWRFPHRWVGITSYGAELAYTLSRAARDNYRAAGGLTRNDADAVKHWETMEGGGLWAAGVGGAITGKGWHLGIVDDPLKNAEAAASSMIREKQKEWYNSTFYTREEPNDQGDPDGALILIQTRWNEDDLSGWQLSQEAGDESDEVERWHIVCFEAIKGETTHGFPQSCTVEADWRQPGEALCPERRPIEKLERIRRRVGEYFWSALFQQRPAPREGSFFKVMKLQYIDLCEVPMPLVQVRAWDLGATEGMGDYTAGVKLGRDAQNRFYILDVRRKQWGTDQRNEQVRHTAEGDGVDVRIRGPQDPGAAGKDAALSFVRLLAGFSVKTLAVSGDKVRRADPFSAQLNAGNVYLVRAPWNAEFVDELRHFPHGKHDDQVDAASDAFNELAQSFELVFAIV